MQDEWKISGGQDAKRDDDDDAIANETALNATSTFHRDVKCYICGEKGHMANKCPTVGDGIKCYNCGGRGHKSTECWTKPENKHKQPAGWKRKKETANSLIDILVVGIEVEVNDNDGVLKCKSTTHDCVKTHTTMVA